MTEPHFDNIQVGQEIPPLVTPPVSRLTLALYAGASGDHNPIHVDLDFAKKAGMDDVFAHGMLGMAYLGRALTNWVPQNAIRQFSTRFVAITHVGDCLTCGGKVVDKFEQDGEKRVRLQIAVMNQAGEIKIAGEAVVALP
ncbi:MAG: MaoC family dehydratase [Anaerolineae bacterium]